MPPDSEPFTEVYDSVPHLDDFQLVQMCLDGNLKALSRLQGAFRSPLIKYLMHAGASELEASEISQEMLTDCLVAMPGDTPKLARYDGTCQLSTWLNTVAFNRLVSVKRRQSRIEKLGITSFDRPINTDDEVSTLASKIADERAETADRPLVTLLKEAVEAGFAACSHEQFVLMHLAYSNRLRLADLGRAWGCNPATISRRLEEARTLVAKTALRHVRDVDPWVEIDWSDFLQLCRTASLGALGFD